MGYLAICLGEEHPVDVLEIAPDCYRVVVGNEAYQIDRFHSEGNCRSLDIGNVSYQVALDPLGENSFAVGLLGNALEVQVIGRKRKKLVQKCSSLDGCQDIRCPMAGNVWKILKTAGDAVRAGEVLMILEAMKMESEIKSPIDGVVTTIFAVEGTSVSTGAPLCIVEAENR